MENKNTKKSLIWLIILLCVVLVAAVAVGVLYFAPKDKAPATDSEKTAEQFIKAYYTRDRLTMYPMYFYNARQQWEDGVIKDNGSAEAFFAEAQKQADAKGIEANVTDFDSYYAAYYRFIQNDFQNIYGAHTITSEATQVHKLEGDEWTQYRDRQLGAINADYIDADALGAVTEAYRITVNLRIDGEKQDFNENYLVYVVLHEGQWLVVSHSM